ncbi:hypothetical protein [Natronosalvus caseinilyticus]|uniref:hypothetical protein n=1 Tax=Natronosalvus caseinilyticus TaxID=2953747 RepID=UPI0028B150F9|nr:hypothetical protein [Natronosalvus caseinilyticus]
MDFETTPEEDWMTIVALEEFAGSDDVDETIARRAHWLAVGIGEAYGLTPTGAAAKLEVTLKVLRIGRI